MFRYAGAGADAAAPYPLVTHEEAGHPRLARARSGRRRWRSSPAPRSSEVVGLAAALELGAGGRAGAPARGAGDRARRRRARPSGRAPPGSGRVLGGEEGIRELIAASGADLVLNGIVGAAGLGPTVVALSEGIDVALANKESLVIGGELTMALAEATGARLLPVDSEHSALLPADRRRAARHRREARPDRLRRSLPRSRPTSPASSVEDALAHPTWEMGGRITIDSATLMNKGFEAIEAHHLFGVPYERIEVVVHPQSIVHSLIDLNDGSSLAHLGHPDMRVPISYALHFPERADVDVPRLDLADRRRADLRAARSGDLRLPAAGARGRRGGGDRALRAQRRRRGRGRRLPRRPRFAFTGDRRA